MTKSARGRRARSLTAIFAMPATIAIISIIGLVTALTGDGMRDIVSWIALAVPVAVIARARLGHPAPMRPRPLVTRGLWLLLGFLFVGLGFIGALVPLMPTTIFLILAVGCFARSSPRLEIWLLDHPRFGPTLRAWRAEGAISRRGKIAACSGIALGYALFWIGARPGLKVDVIVAVVMACCAAFILTRPSPGTGIVEWRDQQSQ